MNRSIPNQNPNANQNADFELHPQLKKDTLFLKELPSSLLLLMNDKRFPWFILVPKYPALTEVFQLSTQQQLQLWTEINNTAKWANQYFSARKMNIAALGNVVPQLHIHIIVRQETDAAWPKPVWSVGVSQPYLLDESRDLIKKLGEAYDSFVRDV